MNDMTITDRLGKLALFYHREAGRCVQARAYLAACVMQGAALEAFLQAMCLLHPEHVKKTTVYKKRSFERREARLWSSSTTN